MKNIQEIPVSNLLKGDVIAWALGHEKVTADIVRKPRTRKYFIKTTTIPYTGFYPKETTQATKWNRLLKGDTVLRVLR